MVMIADEDEMIDDQKRGLWCVGMKRGGLKVDVMREGGRGDG